MRQALYRKLFLINWHADPKGIRPLEKLGYIGENVKLEAALYQMVPPPEKEREIWNAGRVRAQVCRAAARRGPHGQGWRVSQLTWTMMVWRVQGSV